MVVIGDACLFPEKKTNSENEIKLRWVQIGEIKAYTE